MNQSNFHKETPKWKLSRLIVNGNLNIDVEHWINSKRQKDCYMEM